MCFTAWIGQIPLCVKKNENSILNKKVSYVWKQIFLTSTQMLECNFCSPPTKFIITVITVYFGLMASLDVVSLFE